MWCQEQEGTILVIYQGLWHSDTLNLNTGLGLGGLNHYGLQDLFVSYQIWSDNTLQFFMYGLASAFQWQGDCNGEWGIYLAMVSVIRDITEEPSLKIAFLLFQGFTVSSIPSSSASFRDSAWSFLALCHQLCKFTLFLYLQVLVEIRHPNLPTSLSRRSRWSWRN